MRELLAARQSYTLGGDEIRARARIGVQPAARTIRFRYPCEGRSAGSIHGAKTTTTGADRRTFPSIVVDNYVGRVVVVASCVTDAKPHCAHPNNLVGQGCLSGVYIKKQQVLADRNELTISHLGIQCVRKADVQKSLDKRRMQGFDPYKSEFDGVVCMFIKCMRYVCDMPQNVFELHLCFINCTINIEHFIIICSSQAKCFVLDATN